MNEFGVNEDLLPCGADFRDWMADAQGPRRMSRWQAFNFSKHGEQIGRIEVAGDSSGLWRVSCCTAPQSPVPDDLS